ncbi:hypothetical protein [Chitinophaga niabensis]|uniref:Uncharacterized protein n=1 Tax=Chitinophaga niabensis TaxID=536979 RepID=A0A1N6E3G3_9BACT|nr:hypothetical protein [Chitinophaga niabensis]SIN77531.1 hypothetical protein SAMN04488055_1273 [Chitinophaga niabensis]
MKSKLLLKAILLIFLCATFGGIPSRFITNKERSGRDEIQHQKGVAFATFELASGGNRFDPLDYTSPISGTCTLGFAEICALDVLTSAEVYTTVEALVKGNVAFAGKPKVDVAGSSLQTDINDALAYTISIWYLAPNGRMVYKRP